MSAAWDRRADLIGHIRQNEVCTPGCLEFQRLLAEIEEQDRQERVTPSLTWSEPDPSKVDHIITVWGPTGQKQTRVCNQCGGNWTPAPANGEDDPHVICNLCRHPRSVGIYVDAPAGATP